MSVLAHRPAPRGFAFPPRGSGPPGGLRARPSYGPASGPPNGPNACGNDGIAIVDCEGSCEPGSTSRRLYPVASSFSLAIGFCWPPGGPQERV